MNNKISFAYESIGRVLLLMLGLSLINGCSSEPDELRAPEQVDNTVDLIVTKDDIPSDNFSFGEISAITQFRPNANDLIVFNADKGIFSNESDTYSVNVSSNDTTRAFLKYNRPGVVRVTATIFNKFSKEVFVNFRTSFPTQILVSPDSTSLEPLLTSKTVINSSLRRREGSVSEGLLVGYYDSIPPNGESVGTFLNNTYSDSLGNSTVEYHLQDTTYQGLVYIKSFIDTDLGRVTGTNKILIK